MDALGSVYYVQCQFEEAEQVYQQAIAGHTRLLGSNHHETLRAFTNLTILYIWHGELTKTIEMMAVSETRNPALFGMLGKALPKIRGEPNAHIAYQYQMEYQNNILGFVGVKCDGCDQPMTYALTRLVRTRSADTDLCRKCWKEFQDNTKDVASCKGHSFLRICPDALPHRETGWPAKSQEQTIWLQDLAIRYADHTASHEDGQDAVSVEQVPMNTESDIVGPALEGIKVHGDE